MQSRTMQLFLAASLAAAVTACGGGGGGENETKGEDRNEYEAPKTQVSPKGDARKSDSDKDDNSREGNEGGEGGEGGEGE